MFKRSKEKRYLLKHGKTARAIVEERSGGISSVTRGSDLPFFNPYTEARTQRVRLKVLPEGGPDFEVWTDATFEWQTGRGPELIGGGPTGGGIPEVGDPVYVVYEPEDENRIIIHPDWLEMVFDDKVAAAQQAGPSQIQNLVALATDAGAARDALSVQAQEYRRLLAEGLAGTAVIKSFHDSGERAVGNAVCDFELEVTVAGGEPYETKYRYVTPPNSLDFYQVGKRLDVRVDPHDRSKLTFC